MKYAALPFVLSIFFSIQGENLVQHFVILQNQLQELSNKIKALSQSLPEEVYETQEEKQFSQNLKTIQGQQLQYQDLLTKLIKEIDSFSRYNWKEITPGDLSDAQQETMRNLAQLCDQINKQPIALVHDINKQLIPLYSQVTGGQQSIQQLLRIIRDNNRLVLQKYDELQAKKQVILAQPWDEDNSPTQVLLEKIDPLMTLIRTSNKAIWYLNTFLDKPSIVQQAVGQLQIQDSFQRIQDLGRPRYFQSLNAIIDFLKQSILPPQEFMIKLVNDLISSYDHLMELINTLQDNMNIIYMISAIIPEEKTNLLSKTIRENIILVSPLSLMKSLQNEIGQIKKKADFQRQSMHINHPLYGYEVYVEEYVQEQIDNLQKIIGNVIDLGSKVKEELLAEKKATK